MSNHDMTPERLDGLFDGTIPPTEGADRDMLALAGALREAAPGARDELRDRVRAIATDAPAAPGRSRRRLPFGLGRARVAGPVLAAALAAAVSIGIVTRNDSDPAQDLANQAGRESGAAVAGAREATPSAPTASDSLASQTSPGALTSTPPPARAGEGADDAAKVEAGPTRVLVEKGDLNRVVDEAIEIVDKAGGEAIPTPQTDPRPGVLLAITLPPDQARAVIDRVAGLGTVDEPIPLDAGVGTRVLFTEAP